MKYRLLLLFTLITSGLLAQTQPEYNSLPTGTTPYGTQYYKDPSGRIWVGSSAGKFRIVTNKYSLDSLNAAVTAQLAGKVPTTRTVNGKPLSTDITLNKSDVGLSNVDNTSDANKPISTATQTALNTESSNRSSADANLQDQINKTQTFVTSTITATEGQTVFVFSELIAQFPKIVIRGKNVIYTIPTSNIANESQGTASFNTITGAITLPTGLTAGETIKVEYTATGPTNLVPATVALTSDLQPILNIIGQSNTTLNYTGIRPYRLYTSDGAFVTSDTYVSQLNTSTYDSITRVADPSVSTGRVGYFATGVNYPTSLSGTMNFDMYISNVQALPGTSSAIGIGLLNPSTGNYNGFIVRQQDGNLLNVGPFSTTILASVGSFNVGDKITFSFKYGTLNKADILVNDILRITYTFPYNLTGEINLVHRGFFSGKYLKPYIKNIDLVTQNQFTPVKTITDSVNTIEPFKKTSTFVSDNPFTLGADVSFIRNAVSKLKLYGFKNTEKISLYFVRRNASGIHQLDFYRENGTGNGANKTLVMSWVRTGFTEVPGEKISFSNGTYGFEVYMDWTAFGSVTEQGGITYNAAGLSKNTLSDLNQPFAGGLLPITGNQTINGTLNGIPYKIVLPDGYAYNSTTKTKLMLIWHGNGQFPISGASSYDPSATMIAYCKANNIAYACIRTQDQFYTPEVPVMTTDATGWGNKIVLQRTLSFYNYLMANFNFEPQVIHRPVSMGLVGCMHAVQINLIPTRAVFAVGGVPSLTEMWRNSGESRRIPIRAAYGMAANGSDDANYLTFIRGYENFDRGYKSIAGVDYKDFPADMYYGMGTGDSAYIEFGGAAFLTKFVNSFTNSGAYVHYFSIPGEGHATTTIDTEFINRGYLARYL